MNQPDPRHEAEVTLRGDPESFRQAVRMIMEDHEKLSPGHLGLGVMHMVGGQCQLALEEFDRAVAEDTLTFRPYYYRGSALLKLERYPEAIVDLTQAIALHPDLGMAYVERALCYQELGQVDLAERDLQSALMISGATIEGFAQTTGILRARCFEVEAMLEGELRAHHLTEEELEQTLEPVH